MRRFLAAAMIALLALSPTVAVAARQRIRATQTSRWSPVFKSIARGDVVIWKNPTSRMHDVAAYGGNWSFDQSLPAGERVRKRFRRSGHYAYRCTLHSTLNNGECSGMCGAVHVQ